MPSHHNLKKLFEVLNESSQRFFNEMNEMLLDKEEKSNIPLNYSTLSTSSKKLFP